jgi:hypothetical protein
MADRRLYFGGWLFAVSAQHKLLAKPPTMSALALPMPAYTALIRPEDVFALRTGTNVRDD